jgi:hypothetical protein
MCETLEEAHEAIFGVDAQVVEGMMQAFNATDWSES